LATKHKDDFEPYSQDEGDWLCTVEFLPGDDPEGRLFAAATRTITSTSLQTFSAVNAINALIVDSTGNLYVSAGSSVQIFSPTANGDAVSIRTIGGSATTITGVGSISLAVDSGNNIYVSSGITVADTPESILIFNSSANGNVPPTSTIGGPLTTINFIQGLAVDGAGNIYVSNVPSDSPNADILVFSAGSTGNVAPIRTISGPATTMSSIGNLALDSAGNIYVLNDLGLLKFASNATGNVAPIATITTAGGLVFSKSLAVH
jgi:hypothetical protein